VKEERKMEALYDYLLKNFEPNKPIFLSDVKTSGINYANIRKQMKNLVDSGKIKRFDSGIYFLTTKTIFKSGSELSTDDVLEYKYLLSDNKRCGYISGLMFFNQLGLSTQLPMVYEVVSNKATKDRRETTLGGSKVVVRRPKVTVNDGNYKILQFLDLLRDIDMYSEVTGDSLKEKLYRYMDKSGLTVNEMKPYFSYYPDKLYKNLVETGVIFNGIFA
jgi:hypothetical protein